MEQVAAAVEVLIHVRRLPDGRRWVDELRLLRSDRRTGRCRAVPALTCSPDGGLEPGVGWSRLSELAHP